MSSTLTHREKIQLLLDEKIKTARKNQHPLVMGVINVTPDSFSDGGKYFEPRNAINHAKQLVVEGADILDIGGESSRPGATPLTPDEELRRVMPVIEGILEELPHAIISVDTYHSQVADEVLAAGATIINDITGATYDNDMLETVTKYNAFLVVMHMQNDPQTMQRNPSYEDVVKEVKDYLLERANTAVNGGLDPKRVIIDPGIGFGKTFEHNLQLIASVCSLTDLEFPVLLGVSRKSFLKNLEGYAHPIEKADERDIPTAVVSALSAKENVSIVRVHNVEATVEALAVADIFHHSLIK